MFGTQPDTSADRGGRAAGRDMYEGIPPEHLAEITAEITAVATAGATGPLERLNANLQATVAELERRLGATHEQVLGFFRIIGEADIPIDAMPARLIETALRHRALLAQVAPERYGDE